MEWNAAEIARLRELWAEGLSASQIAARLGTTKNAVVGKAHRLHLPPRPSPIHRVDPAVPRPPAVIPARHSAPTLPPLSSMAPDPVPDPAPPAIPRVVQLDGACSYPFGDPGDRGFHFCDAPCARNRSYCDAHHALCFVGVPPVKILAAGWLGL